MRHQGCGARAELDREVAIRNGVERVLAHALEAQLASNVQAIDLEGRPRECRGAEWKLVHAFAAIRQPAGIAREHLEVSEQVMREGDRLRDLQVREAWH